MASEIDRSISIIENAVYGKEVRKAIADGIRLCYDYVSGDAAIEAAEQAREDVARLETVVRDSEEVIDTLREKTATVDNLVIVSSDQPTSPENKIWIRPQADQEYKVATYEAYEELWNHVNELAESYESGHGGISHIDLDGDYSDPNNTRKKKYVITFTDETTSAFYVEDGPQGEPGPQNSVTECELYYHIGEYDNGTFVSTPPLSGWTQVMPEVPPGKHLWTQTIVHYQTGQNAVHYSVGYNGLNGSGAVEGVKLGDVSASPLTNSNGYVIVPLDNSPSANSTALLSSGAIKTAVDGAVTAAVNKVFADGGTFAKVIKAPTQGANDSTTKVATTAFVAGAVGTVSSSVNTLSGTVGTLSETVGTLSEAVDGIEDSLYEHEDLTSTWPFVQALVHENNSCYAYRFGKLVALQICFRVQSAISANQNICSVPEGYEPAGSAFGIVSVKSNSTSTRIPSVALVYTGTHFACDSPLSTGLWRGFIVYGLA